MSHDIEHQSHIRTRSSNKWGEEITIVPFPAPAKKCRMPRPAAKQIYISIKIRSMRHTDPDNIPAPCATCFATLLKYFGQVPYVHCTLHDIFLVLKPFWGLRGKKMTTKRDDSSIAHCLNGGGDIVAVVTNYFVLQYVLIVIRHTQGTEGGSMLVLAPRQGLHPFCYFFPWLSAFVISAQLCLVRT